MKKSEIYKKAQLSVLKDNSLTDETRLEILKFLMNREDLEIYVEKQEEEKKKEGDRENANAGL